MLIEKIVYKTKGKKNPLFHSQNLDFDINVKYQLEQILIEYDFFLKLKKIKKVDTMNNISILTYEDNLHTVIKQDNGVDNLMYEFYITKYLNKQCLNVPCFLETYAVFDGSKWPKYKLKREITVDDKDTAIMIEYVEGQTLHDYISKRLLTYEELLRVLLLLYMFLSNTKDEFTHYDLHAKNIMIVKTDKYIEYTNDNEFICISRYYPKIIDYGRSHLKGKSRVFIDSMIKNSFYKTTKHINNLPTPYILNKSSDLRLLAILRGFYPQIPQKLKVFLRNVVYSKDKNLANTRQLKSNRTDKKIRNVDDAYYYLKLEIDKVKEKNIFGRMNVFTDTKKKCFFEYIKPYVSESVHEVNIEDTLEAYTGLEIKNKTVDDKAEFTDFFTGLLQAYAPEELSKKTEIQSFRDKYGEKPDDTPYDFGDSFEQEQKSKLERLKSIKEQAKQEYSVGKKEYIDKKLQDYKKDKPFSIGIKVASKKQKTLKMPRKKKVKQTVDTELLEHLSLRPSVTVEPSLTVAKNDFFDDLDREFADNFIIGRGIRFRPKDLPQMKKAYDEHRLNAHALTRGQKLKFKEYLFQQGYIPKI